MSHWQHWKIAFILISVIINHVNTQTSFTTGSGTVTFQAYDSSNFQITIKGKIGNWIGLGFGRNMKNVDMHTVEFISSTQYNLYDQWSKGDYAPYADTDLNTTDDLKNIKYSSDSSGYATISYIRAYNTGDKYDYVITPDKSMTISFAWNPGEMNDHKKNFKISSLTIDSSKTVIGNETKIAIGNESGSSNGISNQTPDIQKVDQVASDTSAVIPEISQIPVTPVIQQVTPITPVESEVTANLPQSPTSPSSPVSAISQSSPIVTQDDPEDSSFDFWEFHGIIMTATWSIMNFIGYLSARFFRHYPAWIWVHFIFSGLNAIISVGILGASIVLNDYGGDSLSWKVHIVFGYILFGLTILQILTGTFEYFTIYRNEKINSSSVLNFKFVHKILGMLLTFTSFLSMITGFMGEWSQIIYIPVILCVLLLGVILIFEIINMCNHCWKKTDKLKDFFQSKDNKISTTHTTFNLAQLYDEKRKGKKWVLYDNYICDVTDFIPSHPGGANMISENLFSDMSRYMTGTQAYNSKIEAYAHNMETIKYLIDKMSYGILRDNHNLIVGKGYVPSLNDSEAKGLRNMFSEYISEKYLQIISKLEIAENIFEYKFKSQRGLQFAKILPGVYSLGRHFSLSSVNLNKTRYYSISMCLNSEMKKKHLELIENVKRLENDKNIKDLEINEDKMYSEDFYLYIKKYNYHNALSDHIHSFDVNTQTDLIIRGPIGPGLNLFYNALRGTNIIFAAGTGIIPFIDMIAFAVRYMTYVISKKEHKERENYILKKEKSIFNKISGNMMNPPFRICLFYTNNSYGSSLYMDVIEGLLALDKKYKMNMFRLYTRYSGGDRWDSKFIQDNLKSERGLIDKFYLVGPVQFMEDIQNSVLEAGIIKADMIQKI